MGADTVDRLFEPASAEPTYGVRAGRYRFPAPPGEAHSGNGFFRMTNLVSAFSDQERLQLWLTWKALEGMRSHDHIFDEWMAEPLDGLTDQERSALANLYAEKARNAARSDEAARRGTARHKMTDVYFTTGERTGTRSMRAQLDSMVQALADHHLEVIRTEFRVWHPAAGGTMGTADAEVLCTRTGQVGIFDLKTQARFWTFQEICGQLHGYDSAQWRWEGPADDTGQWVRAERHTLTGHPEGEFAGKRVGLVAHMPQHPGPGQLPVQIMEVDLEYGKEVLDVAARNVELRSRGKSVAAGRRTGVARPL